MEVTLTTARYDLSSGRDHRPGETITVSEAEGQRMIASGAAAKAASSKAPAKPKATAKAKAPAKKPAKTQPKKPAAKKPA